jgi:flavin reductase (DIM6/NTAB) family NADH-FMN oxidoreductase RutF
MLEILPKETPIPQLFGMLIGAIGPRPIALASTLDREGNLNLSPFSFFNVFGANPPLVVFSPSRRGRDKTTKDTYNNVKEIPEVVINVVNYAMLQQVNLASSEFPKGVNEFEKAGFTPIKSHLIRPFRVKESPVQMECQVLQVIETGFGGAAGNLVICKVAKIHVNKEVLNDAGKIDQHKIDLIGRMGGSLYCRASGDAIFSLEKPGDIPPLGIDRLPEDIRNSPILSGNDLGQLGGLQEYPNEKELEQIKADKRYANLINAYQDRPKDLHKVLHQYAKELIAQGDVKKAFGVLVALEY